MSGSRRPRPSRAPTRHAKPLHPRRLHPPGPDRHRPGRGPAPILRAWRAATNLDQQHPWGLWIAIDVASGVALAAGGFTSAFLTHILHREHYHAIARPALLTAMLGYTFVCIGLQADLGRYYNVWHPMIMWQGNSVLFEVGMCVMCYLNVLYVEFAPIICERVIRAIGSFPAAGAGGTAR